MAGTAIFKKQQKTKNSNTANLNITLHSIPASICCCLWLQQPQVVESNSKKCNTNDRPMKENTNNYCHNSSTSCCTTDDRILTNYNYNIAKSVKQPQPTKQRPLTLSVAVIIMSLTILLIQMPTMVQSKSIYIESSNSASADYMEPVAETSAELESKLLLSLLAEAQPREQQYISSEPDESASSASLDELTAKEVLKHIQRTQEHQKERRMRLRKRHARDLVITNYLDDKNGQNLEWRNPCNVDHVDMEAETPQVTREQKELYLKKFELDVLIQYEYINNTANTISISDMAQWDLHEDMYTFLPKLKANGNIALSRWYRNMQVYVASFAHLARIQYKFDMKKRMFAGNTSEELNKLLKSARFMLCELETTINGSAPNNNLKKLKTISRKAMNDRLNFETRHQLNNNDHVVEPSSKDLKFAKSSYFQFLSNMLKILNHKLQNKGRNSSENNFSNTIIVGDDSSSWDNNSIFKSDSSLSVGESIEILFRTTTKKPNTHRRRTHKKKNAKLPEA
ncbi:uncharacterized protein LOC135957438 [Calliphora vicina]|uniref:uncharacterized protein LOC135957438 n=1 Tax=Calliphora vicina TaxID=7373 RepID=UPI00325A642A